MIALVAEVVAVISIVGHFILHFKHKSEERVMLGFLHALKPPIESEAAGSPNPSSHMGAAWRRRSTTCSPAYNPR